MKLIAYTLVSSLETWIMIWPFSIGKRPITYLSLNHKDLSAKRAIRAACDHDGCFLFDVEEATGTAKRTVPAAQCMPGVVPDLRLQQTGLHCPYSVDRSLVKVVHKSLCNCSEHARLLRFARSDIWNTSEALSSTNGHWKTFPEINFVRWRLVSRGWRAHFFVLLYSLRLSWMVEYTWIRLTTCAVFPHLQTKTGHRWPHQVRKEAN